MGVRRAIVFVLTAVGALVAVPPAGATFHLMSIQEVYPGGTLSASSEFVELQMYSSAQNLVQGHVVRLYSATGAETSSATFSAPVSNGENQRSILVGTAEAGTVFNVTPDLTIGAGLDPAGGAACWDTIDCVAWGNFSGSLPSPAGTPEAAIPNGDSLCRSIAAGDPNKLEAADDTNDSAQDFLPTLFPAPRNNSGPATGQPCEGDTVTPDTKAPKTTITKHPQKTSDETTARFKFESNEKNSSFDCKLDKTAFKACTSPRKYKHLDQGKHTFQVEATDAAGNTDKTPAKFKFKVVD